MENLENKQISKKNKLKVKGVGPRKNKQEKKKKERAQSWRPKRQSVPLATSQSPPHSLPSFILAQLLSAILITPSLSLT